jgi:hypothetical protein
MPSRKRNRPLPDIEDLFDLVSPSDHLRTNTTTTFDTLSHTLTPLDIIFVRALVSQSGWPISYVHLQLGRGLEECIPCSITCTVQYSEQTAAKRNKFNSACAQYRRMPRCCSCLAARHDYNQVSTIKCVSVCSMTIGGHHESPHPSRPRLQSRTVQCLYGIGSSSMNYNLHTTHCALWHEHLHVYL